MRDRPHADISDSVDDTNRDSDAPTQLWSGRLSFASITPRLRAARHRQRLEALLNTQTGITFEAGPELVDVMPRPVRSDDKSPPSQSSTNPPVSAPAVVPTSMSGPQLAIFIAVGVAVGGIAALHMDHLLHPFGRQARLAGAEQQVDQKAPTLAANAHAAERIEPSDRVVTPQAEAAVAPAQPPRSLPPKVRNVGTEAPAQVNAAAAAVPSPSNSEPHPTDPSNELRIPTQLHPRVNPLMTSNQVFRDK